MTNLDLNFSSRAFLLTTQLNELQIQRYRVYTTKFVDPVTEPNASPESPYSH